MAASIDLARGRVKALGWRRLLAAWVIQAAVLFVVGMIVPGFLVENVEAALLAAIVIGLLNALVRPVLILLTLPLTVLTAGLLSLVINAIVLVLAVPIVPGLEIDSIWSGISAAILITVIGTLIAILLASDEHETFYAELSRRLSALERARIDGGRGLIVIQIDGLAAPILRNAIRTGLTPTMARWVRSGSHRLVEWECVPPSQTSASQAGIMYGNNDDIPAFRWYEKDRGYLMVSNRPQDAAEIERRVSADGGLLAASGMSANNLFTGGATRTLFTMSRIRQPRNIADVDAFSLFFVDPAAFVRTAVLTVGEIVREMIDARRQVSLRMEPRIHRGRTFAILRAITNVLMRDLNVTFLINAIGRGTPIMYADFVDYDEIAHHAGPERLESLSSLSGVDGALSAIERAAADAPRAYEIVVLSDHGQSQGATFLQRHGYSLDELIRKLMGGASSLSPTTPGEGWGPVNALLAELGSRHPTASRLTSSALSPDEEQLGHGDVVPNDDGAAPGTNEPVPDGHPEVVVGASGNLANVYFLAKKRRMTLEEIEAEYPGLVQSLAQHPDIGFVLVRSKTRGAIAIGPEGIHYLDGDRVEGTDPLTLFGARTADHLRRLDGFTHVGDLLVNSSYDTDLEEVAAFEELVGSHGGFGGPQVRPFVLVPSHLQFDAEPVIGAPEVHRLLRGWADHLGVGPASGAQEAPLLDRGRIPVARGIGAVVALTGVTSLFWLFAGVLALLGGLGARVGGDVVGAGIVLVSLGIVGGVVTRGLHRRRGWARIAALAWYGIGVFEAIAAVATHGIAGLFSIGIVPIAVGFLTFFYLTRSHVAAAFNNPAQAGATGSP